MRERLLILAVLAGFVAVATYPASRALATGTTAARPRLAKPRLPGACVVPPGEMRVSHMRLLVEWRDLAVRKGVRTVSMPDGRTWRTTLTGTCLQCHGAKEEFCDRCHAYAAVTPECWGCHVAVPPGAEAPGDTAGLKARPTAALFPAGLKARPTARPTRGPGGAR